VALFVTTPLDIKHGWLCCKDFDKTIKQHANYRTELGSLSSRQKLGVYLLFIKYYVNLVSVVSIDHCSYRHFLDSSHLTLPPGEERLHQRHNHLT